MKLRSNTGFSQKSNGFALITALLLLIGLMLLGISAMTTSMFDEKLAGNFAHRNVTYQLAEAALRVGEHDATRMVTDMTFQTNGSTYYLPRQPAGASVSTYNGSAVNYNSGGAASNWNNAKTVTVPGMRSTQSVGYFVEELNESVNDGEGINFQYLRVTARARDSVNGSAVVLQSLVRRPRND
jgi:type IV pilus assembly protein PilX